MGPRGVDRQVVRLAKIIQPSQVGVVNHQVRTLRQWAIALVAADATQLRRPGSGAVDDAIPALAELGGELFSESLIVVGYENGTHIESSSDLRLETILHPSSAVNHAPLDGIGIPRTYPGR